MKIEEVIETLKDIYPSQKQIVTGEYPHVAESIDLAIEALEKQITKLPEYKVHEKYPSLGKNFFCQECGVLFLDWKDVTDYCGNCGQKLT